MDREDAKIVWLISLIQISLILGGTSVVFAWSKFHGYSPDHPWFSSPVHFVRNHGLWLLTIPAIWTLAVTLIPENALPEILEDAIEGFGVAVIAGLLLFYCFIPITGIRIPLVQAISDQPTQNEKAEQ